MKFYSIWIHRVSKLEGTFKLVLHIFHLIHNPFCFSVKMTLVYLAQNLWIHCLLATEATPYLTSIVFRNLFLVLSKNLSSLNSLLLVLIFPWKLYAVILWLSFKLRAIILWLFPLPVTQYYIKCIYTHHLIWTSKQPCKLGSLCVIIFVL